MGFSYEEIAKRALLLPFEQRIELARRLWESVGGPGPAMSEEELLEEALRRDAEIEAGQVEGISHEEVMLAARKAIGLI